MQQKDDKKILWHTLAFMAFSTVWGFGNVINGFSEYGGLKAIVSWILIFAIFIITIGGFKLAMSAQKVYSALLGIPRSLVYAMAPVSGIFIIIAQLINLYEDVKKIKIEEGNK